MKILHTSDWHLGKNLEQYSRLEEQEKFLEELDIIVKNKKIDILLIAGDIYDTANPQAKAEQLFYKYIEKINDNGKVPIIIISGNHDSSERLVASNPILNKKGIFIFGKFEEKMELIKNDYFEIVNSFEGGFKIKIKKNDEIATIVNIPFPTEKNLNEIIEYKKESEYQKQYSDKVIELFEKLSENFSEDTINIAMSHIFAIGSETSDSEREIQIGGAYTVNVNTLLEKCDYIALGHMHSAQQLKKAKSPTYYSGSPIQYSKSEANKAKSVYIIDIDSNKKTKIEKEFLSDYKPIIIIKAKDFEDAKNQCDNIKDLNCYVYFEFEVENLLQSEIFELKKMVKNMVTIEFKNFENDLDETSVNFETMSIEEIFKEFYKSNKGCEPNENVVKMFSSLLLEEKEEE